MASFLFFSRLIKCLNKMYFLNIPLFMRLRKQFGTEKIRKTGHWKSAETLTFAKLKELLNERFNSVDFDEAKRDVRPFIADSDKLSLWSKEFFCAITEEWKVG